MFGFLFMLPQLFVNYKVGRKRGHSFYCDKVGASVVGLCTRMLGKVAEVSETNRRAWRSKNHRYFRLSEN